MNKVTPENVRELLTHYMEGACTQEELRQLKEYFVNTSDLPADLIPYAQMFALLSEKQQTPSAEALDRFSTNHVPASRRRIPLWPLLAAACLAVFAFILSLSLPKETERSFAIAYVDGKMLPNEELALQMGQEALQEIFSNGNEEQQLNELFNAQ